MSSISKERLLRLVANELPDSLLEIAFKAVASIISGESPEKAITQAERQALADYADQRLDRALEQGRVPGTGV